MKKVLISFLILFAAIAVGLVFFMIYAINRGSIGTFEYSNLKLVNTQTVSLDAIDTITILYQSEDVIFYESDTDELILKEYMNDTPDNKELSSITTSGSDLAIKNGKQHSNIISFDLFSRNSRIELYLPTTYSKSLRVETSSGTIVSSLILTLSEFTATSSSGDIRMNEVYSERIHATASSGNITFQVAEGTRQFTTSSGDIKVLGGTGDSDCEASSGNITIEKATGHLEAEASSGDIRINNAIGGGDLKTSSGNIKLDLTSVTKSLDIHASSGDITVILPRSASFYFSSETSSGDIRTFFDDTLSYNKKGTEASATIGEPLDIEINISTTSGDIRINE